jgi:hypothetical protein
MECCRGLGPEQDCACAKSRIAELEAALRELTDACIAEFGDGEKAPREPDESSVYAGVPDGQGITFGMLRRARAALSF